MKTEAFPSVLRGNPEHKTRLQAQIRSSFNRTHILFPHSAQHGGLQPYTYTCVCYLSLSLLIYGLVPQGWEACLFCSPLPTQSTVLCLLHSRLSTDIYSINKWEKVRSIILDTMLVLCLMLAHTVGIYLISATVMLDAVRKPSYSWISSLHCISRDCSK